MIVKTLEVGYFASNCYIAGSEATKKGMIVDPGADAGTILDTVNKLGLDIEVIVTTHAHVDHFAALRQVKEATGATFAAHEADSTFKIRADISSAMEQMMGGKWDNPPRPDRLLHEGDVIEIGDLKFAVIHTPGHSPGGICLLGHGVVFTGDTLFNYSIGRTDLPGGDTKVLGESILGKLMTLPDSTVVYPGHGPESTIGQERSGNPFLRGGFFLA